MIQTQKPLNSTGAVSSMIKSGSSSTQVRERSLYLLSCLSLVQHRLKAYRFTLLCDSINCNSTTYLLLTTCRRLLTTIVITLLVPVGYLPSAAFKHRISGNARTAGAGPFGQTQSQQPFTFGTGTGTGAATSNRTFSSPHFMSRNT